MSFTFSYAVRRLPHPAVTGASVSAIMFAAARLVHGWHGSMESDFEVAIQAGVAAFCGFLVFALLSAVLRSFRLYDLLAHSSRDMILVISDQGLILEANDAALSTYGYSRDDFVGMHALQLVRDESDCPIKTVMSTGNRLTKETVHLRSDRTLIPVEMSLNTAQCYGHRVALAIVRDITERKRRELFESIVHRVDRRIIGGETLDSTLRFICTEVGKAYDFALVQVSLKGYDGAVEIREFAGEASEFLESITVRWDDTPEGQGPTGTAIRTGVQQFRDLTSDGGFDPWIASARDFGLCRAVATPLLSSVDVLGALTAFSSHEITETDAAVLDLERFAEQIALSLAAVQGQEQMKLQRTAMESAANGIMVTDAGGVILWANPAMEELTGYTREELLGQTPRIFKSKSHEPAFYRSIWETIASGQVWRGEIYNKRRDGSIYLEEQTITPVIRDDGEIAHFVAIKEDLSEAREHEEQLAFLSMHDPMTELPNRKAFINYLDRGVEQALRGRKGTILVTNIHNFGLVNEALGHTAGDQMLRQFGSLLKQTFRPSDPLARIVGDEFAVLLEGASVEVAKVASDRLRRAVEGAGAHDGWGIPTVGLSMGIAEIDGAADPERVIHRARVAMTAARDVGHAIVYSRELEESSSLAEGSRRAMRVQEAIDDGRLLLEFQKVVCLTCGRPEHFEALVRMIAEDGSIVQPDAFLPTAERFGLIRQIDAWVVRRVLGYLRNDPDLKIFVNISGSSLTDDVFLAQVVEQIETSGTRPGQVTFEITEATAVTDIGAAQKWIRRLKRLGCQFALDDFGIGFSSLAYLQSLPVDFVKIDRSFIADIHNNATNRAIVRAVQNVAATLGKEVIAEGVETKDHFETLRLLGIARGQGFHWGIPSAMLGDLKPDSDRDEDTASLLVFHKPRRAPKRCVCRAS